MKKLLALTILCIGVPWLSGWALAQSTKADRGQRVFAACAPCHSLVPDKNMTV